MMGKARFINRTKKFTVGDRDVLADSLDFIESSLSEMDISRKLVMRTLVLAEEVVQQLLENGESGSRMRVQVRRFLGDASVSFHTPGLEFDLLGSTAYTAETLGASEDMEDRAAQEAIRSILLRSQGDKLKYAHRNKENHVRLAVGLSEQSQLPLTIAGLVLGLIFGVLLRTVIPAGVSEGVSTYLLDPVKTMFMNALQIIVGPVVFFSIVSCISQFQNLAELGRIGAKVMLIYTMTSLVAVLCGIGFSLLFHPGAWGFALSPEMAADAVSVDANADISILNTIVNIVPANFVRPFLESETLQLIFLGVLCGVALGMIGEYTAVLQNLIEACNSLFLTMTTMIARCIPAAVFCSASLMILDLGAGFFLEVLGMAGVQILAIACMMVFYGLMILSAARLDPVQFFKKSREGMLTSFTLSSSNAAMPTNMRVCTDKLGISTKVCSFSIPLGATINMDGTCVALACTGLFLARAYGVAVPASSLLPLIITVMLLSLGAPGVPGSGVVCLCVILNSLGVPIEGIGLILGISPLLDMVETMSNTTGDMATALIVAKSEGLLDEKIYYTIRPCTVIRCA